MSPQTGLLKSTLLQLDSTFSERNYGASSFLDFAEKLAQAGLVQLKHSGRSVMVELNPGFAEDGEQAPRAENVAEPRDGASSLSGIAGRSRARRPPTLRPAGPTPLPSELPPQAGDNAEGVRLAGQILPRAPRAGRCTSATPSRSCAAQAFDERRYGFGGLIDLLRACQREGYIRLERDRRGGLRRLPGSVAVGHRRAGGLVRSIAGGLAGRFPGRRRAGGGSRQ